MSGRRTLPVIQEIPFLLLHRMAHFGLRGICEADRAAIRALLRGQPPPGIIFSPGRRPPVPMRLQTADHRRRASPVQEEQGAAAPCDWARIMRFPVCEQVDTVALSFAHHRRGIFSAPLCHQGLLPVLSRLRQTDKGARRAAGIRISQGQTGYD